MKKLKRLSFQFVLLIGVVHFLFSCFPVAMSDEVAEAEEKLSREGLEFINTKRASFGFPEIKAENLEITNFTTISRLPLLYTHSQKRKDYTDGVYDFFLL